MAAFVKVCPNCNHENPVNEIFCENCDYDLSRVPTSPPKPEPSQVPASVGRMCPSCGQIAPMTTVICPNCGASLAAAQVTAIDQSAKRAVPTPARELAAAVWALVSRDNMATLSVKEGDHLQIGWECELGAYFQRTFKDFVSNRHGTLSVLRGELFFEDDSSNGTLVNNCKIARKLAHKLRDGDELCLGGTPGRQMAQAGYFRVEKR